MSDGKYSCCAICGGFFRIGRIRTIQEPVTAAWNVADPEHKGNTCFRARSLDWGGGCDRFSGCMLAFRYDKAHACGTVSHHGDKRLRSKHGKLKGKFNEANISIQGSSETKRPPMDKSSEYIKVVFDPLREEGLVHIGRFETWRREGGKRILQRQLQKEGFVFPSADACAKAFDEFEHLAGPGCMIPHTKPEGYNGQWISVEEMHMSHIAQSLVRRQRPSEPYANHILKDEESFTGNGGNKWYLGTLSTTLSHLMPLPCFAQKQSASEPTAEYVRAHSACLEVFERASIRRNGQCNFDTLADWYWATKDFDGLFPRDPRIYQYVCLLDDDWLVANPCYVPGFDKLIQRLTNKSTPAECSDASKQNSQQSTRDNECPPTAFIELPSEIYVQIFDRLHVTTVAAAIVAFPDLRQRLNPYLLARLNKDSPHLWEFWSQQPYSLWTTKQMCEISLQVERELSEEWYGVGEPDFEYATERVNSAHDQMIEEIGGITESAAHFVFDDTCGIDLAELVVELELATKRKEVKGFGNRKRIWRDCERILHQIDALEKYTNGDWDVLDRKAAGRWTRGDSRAFEEHLYGKEFDWLYT